MSKPDAILIAGPTASGKTHAALSLTASRDIAVVNADSMQVYRDLPILTACPSVAEQAGIPHHLFAVRDGAEPWSAAGWAESAEMVIKDIWATQKTPVVVGGTGLYFRALTDGLSDIPEIPDNVRKDVRELEIRALAAALVDEDPVMAERLNENDQQRMARALEVMRATGISLAEWQSRVVPGLLAKGNCARVVLLPPRDVLYARIDARFDAMLEGGALEEVGALMARDLDPSLPVMKALGVPPLMAYLRGDMDMETATERAKTESRQYAKRQMTWFRNQFSDWPCLDPSTDGFEHALSALVVRTAAG